MSDFLARYFPEISDYPDPVEVMMEYGHLLSFVSDTFLNGWINYVEVKAAYLITRYSDHLENVADTLAFNKGGHAHADLAELLDDDVLILAQPKCTLGEWWFFHSDRDTSDCSIGRFATSDDTGTVIRLFGEHARRLTDPPIPLEPASFCGWVSL